MRFARLLLMFLWAALLGGLELRAETIRWYSAPNQTNLTSTDSAMTGDYEFELGVFVTGFTPTSDNRPLWAANWRRAERTSYHADTQEFENSFTVTAANSTGEFTLGKPVYVWGFKAAVGSSEWILFRHADWTWPAPNPTNPTPPEWNAADATPFIGTGTIHDTGSPFLMQSVAVTDAASPPTTWEQWQADEFVGEPLNGKMDDPDHDGTNNLLEYVFGLPPRQAGPPPQTPVALVGGYLQITIPRRMDHPATLTVEVSDDLTNWSSGTGFTTQVSDTPQAWVVRDNTQAGPGQPQRFMRLKVELP